MTVTLHGPAYSTYARTARLALEEKGVAYTLDEVDMLGGATQKPDYLAKQPFGKVPALDHDGFALYETFAIARYVDEAFDGPALQPADAKARARMTQICSVMDSYTYGNAIGKAFWQAAIVPMQGGTPDQAVMDEGFAKADLAFDAIEALCVGGPFLCGESLSLADLHLLPVVEYFASLPAGRTVLDKHPKVTAWAAGMASRDSVVKTRPNLG
ncbi:glutathione S-transferase family protein [Plastoroseomonas arctica]|uniref:glutathione transferase n=1 Tax=Plastoroseomonas arctica TaxID=1509237 RepID=A0AAF1JXM4_9PROT|nr:glutathione S-transferase family protein [Plastoroseomonas arctica]MBR0656326.1 glutathione S-transferase family protein [Plastoroseomonas arctica]